MFVRNFKFILKKQMKMFVFISLKKQVKMLVSISYLVSFGIYIHIQYFCGKWEINSNVNVLYILSNEKYFPKTISQWEFDDDLIINLRRIIIDGAFSVSSLKLRRGTRPPLKTTCHIKLKLFLWTKLVQNLLLAKYLIFVGATLRNFFFSL